MQAKNNRPLFDTLREKHPFFTFEDYSFKWTNVHILIRFEFNLSDAWHFSPEIRIPLNRHINKDNLSDAALHNLICHMGMIEMLSYWKSACPPLIIIKPFTLTNSMAHWWQHLYYNGLGEFLYLNNIQTSADELVTFKSDSDKPLKTFEVNLSDSNLIPVGGGKDSAVTMQLLNDAGEDNLIFFLNPEHIPVGVVPEAIRNTSVIQANRLIAPELLQLNSMGYLNGHTPFSAMLAFLSLLMGGLSGRKNIVLSNESSANEPTVPGTDINHQYSKTIAFESDFRSYVAEHISKDFNYFSFLRPLSEYQIALLFTRFPQHFDTFRSCNAGSKQGIWCCTCSKCLFTYTLLSAFITPEQMMRIFGTDLFANESMLPILNALTGASDIKPFDCVGTIEDVNVSLVLAIEKHEGKELPALLKSYASSTLYTTYKNFDRNRLMRHFDQNNFVPLRFEKYLRDALSL